MPVFAQSVILFFNRRYLGNDSVLHEGGYEQSRILIIQITGLCSTFTRNRFPRESGLNLKMFELD